MSGEASDFHWNAEECLKILDRGFRIVLMQDGLGSITALAIPKTKSLGGGLREWRENELSGKTTEDIQRFVFEGPERFSGCGFTVAEALHSLTEKVVFCRLPDGKGGYYTPPPKTDNG